MTWNSRVVRRRVGSETAFAIHEAYYEDGKDEPHLITTESVAPMGESVDELRRDLEQYAAALDQPVLECDDFAGRVAPEELHEACEKGGAVDLDDYRRQLRL